MLGSSSHGRALTRPWALLFPMTALAIVLAGCPKSDEGNKATPAGSARAAAPAAPAEDASTGDDASSAKPAGQAATYGGSYSLSPATYYIPSAKDYGNVKQAKDDPTKHVGEGKLTLTVDGDGKVTGTIDSGPASPGVIEGSMIDGEIRGFVRRTDPSDQGLTGTFTVKPSGNAGEGTLALAEANAAVVREGKLSLEKK